MMSIRHLGALCCTLSSFALWHRKQTLSTCSWDKESATTNLFHSIYASRKDSRFLLPERMNFENPPSIPPSYLRVGTMNLKTGRIDDKIKEDFPYLTSTNRDDHLAKLLPKEADLIAFCEGAPLKRIDQLITKLPENIKCIAYCTGKKGAGFHQSIDTVKEMEERGEDPYIGEFVGIAYDQNRLKLLQETCISLPEGKKHSRIAVSALFLDQRTQAKIALYSFQLDHLDPSQRERSVQILRKHSEEFKEKNHLVLLAGDTNFFLDQDGEKYFQAITAAPFYDPRKVVEKHYGPPGTIKGDPTWNKQFLPPIKQAPFGHFYRDGTPIDLIVAREQSSDSTIFFIPKFTAIFPGYFDDESGVLYELSDKVNRLVLEKGVAVSDHNFVVTTFKPQVSAEFLYVD